MLAPSLGVLLEHRDSTKSRVIGGPLGLAVSHKVLLDSLHIPSLFVPVSSYLSQNFPFPIPIKVSCTEGGSGRVVSHCQAHAGTAVSKVLPCTPTMSPSHRSERILHVP